MKPRTKKLTAKQLLRRHPNHVFHVPGHFDPYYQAHVMIITRRKTDMEYLRRKKVEKRLVYEMSQVIMKVLAEHVYKTSYARRLKIR